MFGSRVADGLLAARQPVRALVRDRSRGARLEAAGAELAVADMDRPESLPAALQGVQRVFIVSPMDGRIEARETAITTAARAAGVELVVKLYGAVRHHGELLDRLHLGSIEALRGSGLRWALLSPTSVMETSLLAHAESIKQTGAMWGCAGEGKVALIAADDVGAAGVALLCGEPESGRNYEVTGPDALNMAEMAQRVGAILGRTVTYNDMPEDAFRDVLVRDVGMTADQAEIGVIAHLRAWRRGDAALVTDTLRELTGREPLSLEEWLRRHREAFE